MSLMPSRRRVVAADLETIVLGALRVADVLIVALAAIVSYYLRHENLQIPGLYILAIFAAVALTANYMQIAHLYVFAQLHDSQRMNEYTDQEHGPRAAAIAEKAIADGMVPGFEAGGESAGKLIEAIRPPVNEFPRCRVHVGQA